MTCSMLNLLRYTRMVRVYKSERYLLEPYISARV
jgi:hypothetical protein